MKTLATTLLLGALAASAQAPNPKVRKIYVAVLHFPNNPDVDGLVRSKLIASLAQSCNSACSVVDGAEVPDDPDGVVLTGDVLIQTADSRHYRMQGAMRLVEKEGGVLWADTVYSSPYAKSATSSFADNVAKKLTAFLAKR